MQKQKPGCFFIYFPTPSLLLAVVGGLVFIIIIIIFYYHSDETVEMKKGISISSSSPSTIALLGIEVILISA